MVDPHPPTSFDPCPSQPSKKYLHRANTIYQLYHHPLQHARFKSPPLIASFISDHILAMSIECWCLTLYFFGCQNNSGMVLLCSSFLVGFRLFYGTVGCVFIRFSGTRIIKREGKSENIGRPYKYLTYT